MTRPSAAAPLVTILFAVACGDMAEVQRLPGAPYPADPGARVERPTDDGLVDPTDEQLGSPNDDLLPAVGYQTGLDVELDSGPIHGYRDGDLRLFKGIPYAASPTGELRFRPPVAPTPWRERRPALDFGPACPQQPLPTMSSTDNMSEDCLSANVYAHDDGRVRPVMLWIYGGGFVVGGADWSIYDARGLAERGDVVVVSINYRMGAFGYLATEELQATDPLGSTGNQGLLDQIEALRWVRRNAPAFGGDPYNVTVFGESAGGMSVCALLGAPMADGLYRNAISQSGGGCNTFTFLDHAGPIGSPPAFETGRELVEAVGCGDAQDQVACLQAAPTQDFVDAASLTDLFTGTLGRRLRVVPTVDGVVLHELPIERMKRGELPPEVHAIFGSNEDEATLFTALDTIASRAAFAEKITDVIGAGPALDMVLELYPRSEYPIAKDAYIAFMGDAVFNCGTMSAAHAMGHRGRVYYFSSAPALIDLFMGTMHAVDALYLFGGFASFGMIPTETDQEITRLVQDAWSSFARIGRPVFPGGWPAFAPGRESIAVIDDDPRLVAGIRDGRCDQLRAIGLVP